MADLAATYHQQDRSDEAEEMMVKVLRLRKEVLSEKHPITRKASLVLCKDSEVTNNSNMARMCGVS